MTYRLLAGIEPREDFPSLPLFEELLREKHLLIADHTRRWLRNEITFPGPAIDRADRARWAKHGRQTLGQRAEREVTRLVEAYTPSRLAEDIKGELTGRMSAQARRHGMDRLPAAAD
jgi:trimethylamine:corrinoid methyltransferase-like protein